MASASNGIVNHPVGSGVPLSGNLDAVTLSYPDAIFLQVAVDNPLSVILPRSRLEQVPISVRALDAPATLFGLFGGTGADGNRTVNAGENLGAIRREYNNLTVGAAGVLNVDQGWGFIAVKGVCTIAGSISADGVGEVGANGALISSGENGPDATGRVSSKTRVPQCASGGGGGGGAGFNVSATAGGDGGGAQDSGGTGGISSAGGSATTYTVNGKILAGGVSSTAGSGQTFTSNFQQLLTYRGAGGGGGGGGGAVILTHAGNGGNGGGVLYIECNELNFTGALSARGNPGLAASPPDSQFGSGGGGGGGVVLVRARKITTNSGTVSVAGGPGGPAPGAPGFAGGHGVPGFWDIVQIR